MSVEFLITALIVVLIPGTGVVYTVATGLGRGRVAGIVAAFGCTMGIVPHILASVLGLAAILHTSALVFQVFKYAGVAYLLYLAWQTLQARGPLNFEPSVEKRNYLGIARTGFLINILNPKLSIFFLAFLPQFVAPEGAMVIAEMLGLGAVFMAMTFAVFVVYGLFAAWTGEWILKSKATMKWMRRVTALVFGGMGARLALSDA